MKKNLLVYCLVFQHFLCAQAPGIQPSGAGDDALREIIRAAYRREPADLELAYGRDRMVHGGLSLEELGREFRSLAASAYRIQELVTDQTGQPPSVEETGGLLHRFEVAGWNMNRMKRILRENERYQVHQAELRIRAIYREELLREPSDKEIAGRVEPIRSGALRDRNLRRELRDTLEYRRRETRETIAALYRDLLGRAPSELEQSVWTKQLLEEGLSLRRARRTLMQSEERKIFLAEKRIHEAYERALKREVRPEEIETHLDVVVERGFSVRQIEKALKLGPEFLEVRVASAFERVLIRPPDEQELAKFVSRLQEQGWGNFRLRREIRDWALALQSQTL